MTALVAERTDEDTIVFGTDLPYARSLLLWPFLDHLRISSQTSKRSWMEGWFRMDNLQSKEWSPPQTNWRHVKDVSVKKLVPTPGLEPGTPWCLLRRCFPTTVRCSPTELSEVVLWPPRSIYSHRQDSDSIHLRCDAFWKRLRLRLYERDRPI